MTATTTLAPRFDLAAAIPRAYAGLARVEELVELDGVVRSLVKVRASQLNGCAFCIDMHWRHARADGEREERLFLLDAWRESHVFSDRERAALALCEAMTQLAPGGIPDGTWEEVAAWFDEPERHHLVLTITMINAWNRLAITSRAQPAAA